MKRGFTLIEIMAVITLIALITLVVVPSILKQVSNEKENVNQVTLQLIYEATSTYITPRYHTYKKVSGNVYCIPLETLVNNKVLDKNLVNFETGKTIPLNRIVKAYVNSYQQFEYSLLAEGASCVEVDESI